MIDFNPFIFALILAAVAGTVSIIRTSRVPGRLVPGKVMPCKPRL